MTRPRFWSALAVIVGVLLLIADLFRFQEEPFRLILIIGIQLLLYRIFEADRTRRSIPLVPVILLGFLGAGEQFFFRTVSFSIIAVGLCAGAIFFGAQYLLSKGRLIGRGDVYLGIALGAVFGGPRVLFVILLSYVLGSCIALGLLATKRIARNTPLPLGSFLVLGSLCTLFLDCPWSLVGIS